jgi:hypothetical protein
MQNTLSFSSKEARMKAEMRTVGASIYSIACYAFLDIE